MSKNNRFPEPTPNPQMKSAFQVNSRFPPPTSRPNPFTSGNDRYQQREQRPINSRAAALLGDSSTNNTFNPPRNSRFAFARTDRESRDGDRDHRRDGGDRDNRRGNRFRNDRRSYFTGKRSSTKPKIPDFDLKKDNFPELGLKKATVENKPMSFGTAANRGKECLTPPMSPKPPPPARLERPQKVCSDDESEGWRTEDEDAARAANPSDDEEEEFNDDMVDYK